MIYTFLFYILLLFITTVVKSRKLAINLVVVLAALYMGLRYDYMPDYRPYYEYFNKVSSGYNYLDGEHMEYGWYILNKICGPLGFYGFEFVISAIFAYSIGLVLKIFVSKEYLPYVVMGYFTSGLFAMTLSAHRQLVVAAIFIIAFVYLVNNHIKTLKDLVSFRLLLYYLIIFLLTFIHTSAYFLLVIPILYLIPRNYLFPTLLIILIFSTIFMGEKFLPDIIGDFYLFFDRYERSLEADVEMQNMTLISLISYIIQIVFIAYALLNKILAKEHRQVLIFSLLTIFLSVSIFTLPQLYRLNIYIGCFAYIAISSIGISLRINNNKLINSLSLKLFYGIWIFWNACKAFTIEPGTVQEYKSIISLLFV